MHNYQKLIRIHNRIESFSKTLVEPDFSREYKLGFDLAVKLFNVAMNKEFGESIRVEFNKHHELREQKKENEKLANKIYNQKRYIAHLVEENSKFKSITLPRSKRNKIIRSIAEMTGSNYEEIRDMFKGIVQINESK
ncbi:hypothetical protein I6I97_17330 [Sphingobacterium multivorum]|uniref:hypothetical protein n=1 Tax=Sphingobacterium multivorum TaxID=28454 RepID=UPI001919DC24|nr:hypothetical protein [Sphingobacterium multivorum]QQT60963.1 hypothetical protein I6I97_17330 [Sphingobacterium multivorum]